MSQKRIMIEKKNCHGVIAGEKFQMGGAKEHVERDKTQS
jgi:hypothetical protein